MKEIIIDVRLLSRGGISGIEEYTRSLVSELLRTDKKNQYVLFYNGFHKVPLPKELAAAAAVDKKLPNKVLEISSRLFSWPKIEKWASGDLVFSPHFNIIATDLPRIITFHDLSFMHHPDFFLRRQRFWHWLQNCRRQALKARRIIAVSEFTKSDLINLFNLPEDKIKVVYSGINPIFKRLPRDDVPLSAFQKLYRLYKPFILYLGTIEPRKNVFSIIKVFNALKEDVYFKDWELVIAGQRGWLFKEVIKEADSSRFRDAIRFFGKISSGDRVFLYNLATAFIYPSFFEGFGFPPLEAQACGVPVVASNRTSLPEILGDSAILTDPWRLDEIYFALCEAVKNEKRRASLINAGFENAKRFSWSRAARETIKIYNE